MDIIIGKNKHHNWKIINAAEQHDLWFHVADSPSSHCILVTHGETPTYAQIKQVAVICKQHSRSKSLKKVEINYTEIWNVQKDVRSGPGSVILTGACKSIYI